MACCLDAVFMIIRESACLATAPRQFRDGVHSTQVNLRQHYKRWTGRAFRMRAACQKYDVPQCNRRRDIIDGGRNHYHFLAGDDLPGRASVEYEATYRGVAETRRGARRMGVPVETGVVVKYVRLSVRFLQFLNLNFASMASTRCRTAATPSS